MNLSPKVAFPGATSEHEWRHTPGATSELEELLAVRPDGHIDIVPSHDDIPAAPPPVLKTAPPLRGYFFPKEEELSCIAHNQRWAHGLETSPRFLFAYLNLWTSCELHCKGCFQGLDLRPTWRKPWIKTWIYDRLDEILDYLISTGGTSVTYVGLGELMTDPGAFELVQRIRERGLGFVMFTNGQVLSDPNLVERLDELGVTLILSFRDTCEAEHDCRTGRPGSFRRTLSCLSHCLRGSFRDDHRLAIEMPITKINAERAPDMLVAARRLGVVPFLEMYVVTGRSDDVIAESLTFTETDAVLEEMSALDRRLGFDTSVEWGQRIIGRPPCVRPKYTFTVLPDHSLMACPASQLVLGNCADSSIRASIETEDLKRHVLSEGLCPCSTYAGMDANNIPVWLPPELIKLIDRTDEWLSA